METADNGCCMLEAFGSLQSHTTVVENTNVLMLGNNCFQNEPSSFMYVWFLYLLFCFALFLILLLLSLLLLPLLLMNNGTSD